MRRPRARDAVSPCRRPNALLRCGPKAPMARWPVPDAHFVCQDRRGLFGRPLMNRCAGRTTFGSSPFAVAHTKAQVKRSRASWPATASVNRTHLSAPTCTSLRRNRVDAPPRRAVFSRPPESTRCIAREKSIHPAWRKPQSVRDNTAASPRADCRKVPFAPAG